MDNNLLINRISDAVCNAQRKYATYVFGFCDESEQGTLSDIIKQQAFTDYMFWGGYTDAERKCLGIFPSTPKTEDFFIVFIKITGDKFNTFSHRDCMGSLLASGIKRDILGDILIIDDRNAYVAVFNQDGMADYLCREIKKIGRCTVKCTIMPQDFVPEIQRKFQNISFTVSSIRLDSVVAGAVNTSRSAASTMIREGRVTLNHKTCTRPDEPVKTGNVFSVHKKGKFIMQENSGLTKKDRIRVNLKKYL